MSKSPLVPEQVRHAGLLRKIAPGRHRLSQQACERAPVAMSSSRQRLPGKTRQPRKERWQRRQSDGQGAFWVEEEAREIAQDIGIADRRAGVGSQRSGIAEGGARTWLIRVDDNDLPAS
jgi:hypothetical protein